MVCVRGGETHRARGVAQGSAVELGRLYVAHRDLVTDVPPLGVLAIPQVLEGTLAGVEAIHSRGEAVVFDANEVGP